MLYYDALGCGTILGTEGFSYLGCLVKQSYLACCLAAAAAKSKHMESVTAAARASLQWCLPLLARAAPWCQELD
jgi:hypothetical protein